MVHLNFHSLPMNKTLICTVEQTIGGHLWTKCAFWYVPKNEHPITLSFAFVPWQNDVRPVAESCHCGSIRVLFALLKWPNLVKTCLASKYFGLKYISFILCGSCMMSELARHHRIIAENKHRVVACESSGVCGYRRGEQGHFPCSLLLSVPWKCEGTI